MRILLAILALAACADPLTEVVVVTDTDLLLPADIDAVRFEITGSGSAPEVREALNVDANAMPLQFSIVHRSGSESNISVVAFGMKDGDDVVRQATQFDFVRGERRYLQMFLSSACRGVPCDTPPAITCVAGECVVPLPFGPPDDAAGVDAGVDAPRLPDIGSPDIGSPDIGSPDIGSPDIGPPDIGPPDAPMCTPDSTCDRDGCTCNDGCCDLTCADEGECRVRCESGSMCTATARPGSDIDWECKGDATCTFSPEGAGTISKLKCKDDSSCVVECGDTPCSVDCEHDSTYCECRGTMCSFSRCGSGDERTCAGPLVVCGGEGCPP